MVPPKPSHLKTLSVWRIPRNPGVQAVALGGVAAVKSVAYNVIEENYKFDVFPMIPI
jgi:hypothetical protein